MVARSFVSICRIRTCPGTYYSHFFGKRPQFPRVLILRPRGAPPGSLRSWLFASHERGTTAPTLIGPLSLIPLRPHLALSDTDVPRDVLLSFLQGTSSIPFSQPAPSALLSPEEPAGS